MSDSEVKLSLQTTARIMLERYLGRAFAFFVGKDVPGHRSFYVSNAGREDVIKMMQELIDVGLPGLPSKDTTRS